MDYKKAFDILDIDVNEVNYNDLTLRYLKKKYHKLALQNHPDKNGNTEESNEKFKKIKEAYDFLKREIKNINKKENNEKNMYDDKDDDNSSSIYYDILKVFMESILIGQYNEIISKIVNEIVNGCKKISSKLFDDLDKDTLLNIYIFLSKYRYIFHLGQNIIDEIREIVIQKYDNSVQIYKLNPNLNDLLNNNVYKLYIEETLYLVPLWYSESYFDGSGCEIIVLCEPELPENIYIDDDNNLCIERNISISNELSDFIINNKNIEINVNDKIYEICLSKLYIKKEQYYRIKNEGITKIKKDIYDISERSDIIIKINFV
jgi:curved DNA-binding protein CbpA